mmetsp:Transcript_34657/g.31271  ORF Transcript_34657/g.31271 Transcript_34657/m.31271 type:complete len:118 (+) Transcript_34657:58-411(+)
MLKRSVITYCILLGFAVPILASELLFDGEGYWSMLDTQEELPQNEQCELDEDCKTLYNCINNECIHKDLFPLTSREIFSTILIMVISGFANSGGLGGGALLSPILLIGFNYPAAKAI